jgi:hypothetical protein
MNTEENPDLFCVICGLDLPEVAREEFNHDPVVCLALLAGR